jgi:hypothetical protein
MLFTILTFLININNLASSQTAITNSEILNHPIYLELEEKKEFYEPSFVDFTVGVSLTQLSQNKGQVFNVNKYNLFNTVKVGASAWPIKWVGIEVDYAQGFMVLLGAKEDTSLNNNVLITPYWLNATTNFRYKFNESENSSDIVLKTGYHRHRFPINTNPNYINKVIAEGITLGLHNKFAIGYRSGFNFGFDLLILPKYQDKSNIENAQDGRAYKFNIEFYTTILDIKKIKTLITFGYSQTTYASEIYDTTIKDRLEANHFEQSYRSLYITFTAKL